jgi:hypothetical protein
VAIFLENSHTDFSKIHQRPMQSSKINALDFGSRIIYFIENYKLRIVKIVVKIFWRRPQLEWNRCNFCIAEKMFI